MKKITIRQLRAVPPYNVVECGNTKDHDWKIEKLPNHQWNIHRIEKGQGEALLNRWYPTGEIVPKNEARNYVECDDKVLDRYWTGGEK